MRLEKQKYRLTCKDDGSGFNENRKNDKEHHFGHFLIEGFAEQLNGSIQKRNTDSGVHFELEFE